MKTHYTLLTGASQGLGKSIALELAKKQENLILVSLPNSGQETLADYIVENFNIDVHHIELDLSDTVNYKKIADYVSENNLQIKYLINNAGILSRDSFENLSSDFILKQIEVNVVAPTLLIKYFLKNLKENTPSGILNVSSLAGFFPLIQKQVYCGTKAYILSFSKALRKELKKDNISVTTVCPGGLNTTTKLCYQNRILGWIARESVLSPEEAAKRAIHGMLEKEDVVIPGFINKCLLLLDKILPQFLKDSITANEIKKFKD
ncbi:MAG: SDR family NAD(P)-dependent oxidoreductase [Flavobacteriaceae bacterium]|nr:SDR family NAD(P)-dependent oxidoreductase [Flavobacteriaceae bacterium]